MSVKLLARRVRTSNLLYTGILHEIGQFRPLGEELPPHTVAQMVAYVQLHVYGLDRETVQITPYLLQWSKAFDLRLKGRKPDEESRQFFAAATFGAGQFRQRDVRSLASRSHADGVRLDCWTLLDDSSRSVGERTDAIEECSLQDPDKLLDYVLATLTSGEAEPAWRDILVGAVECLPVSNTGQREELAEALLGIAGELRCTGSPHREGVAWSALRKFSLLVPRERASELAEFLDPSEGVDTRLIALICIGRIFEVEPIIRGDDFAAIAHRAYSYATKFLDPDVLSDGWNAAVAQASVKALVFLGDERVGGVIERMRAAAPAWFNEQMYDKLVDARQVWAEVDSGYKAHAAYKQIESHINALNPTC